LLNLPMRTLAYQLCATNVNRPPTQERKEEK
jgi:hypothetical protein